MAIKFEALISREDDVSISSFVAGDLSPAKENEFKLMIGMKWNSIDNANFHTRTAYARIFERGVDVSAEAVAELEVSWFNMFRGDADESLPLAQPSKNLLTKDEEISLFTRFNYASYRVIKVLRRLANRRLSVREVDEALHWAKIAYRERDKIVLFNLGLILRIAKLMGITKRQDVHDYLYQGKLALLRAIDGFDVKRGMKFSTYAWWTIKRGFFRAGQLIDRENGITRTRNGGRKKMVHFVTLVTLNGEQHDASFNSHEERFIDHRSEEIRERNEGLMDLRYILNEYPNLLTDREKTVLHRRFWGKETLKDIGKDLRITKERVRQVESEAISKLRDMMIAEPNRTPVPTH